MWIMDNKRILIVEDESIVAENLKERIEKLGYQVIDIISTGEEAIKVAVEQSPDLVLMDIMLAGKMDGVEAAGKIHSQVDIPIVYLTAYSDPGTLQRAKITQPFGYLIKPFKERELHTTIEIALYKHQLEHQLKENEQWLSTVLRSIGDSVITTDKNGDVTYMSPIAEKLIGKQKEAVLESPITNVVSLKNDKKNTGLEFQISRILKGEVSQCLIDPETILVAEKDKEIPVDVGLSALKDDHDEVQGVVLAIRDITERKQVEEALNEAQQILVNLLTTRERELLQMMVDGASTKEIAFDLEISPRTVEAHKQNMMQKLNIHDTPMLIRTAIVQKLVIVDDLPPVPSDPVSPS